MKFPRVNPTKTKSWSKLLAHKNNIKTLDEFFSKNQNRQKSFSIEWNKFFLDFSKTHVDRNILEDLVALAEECGLSHAIDAMFSGKKINETEQRAVMHFALRSNKSNTTKITGVDLKKLQQKIYSFSELIINGHKKGVSGKRITDVVNIGIGGSDLGPKMITKALSHYKNNLEIHFISNIDGDHVFEVLKKLNPETTLFLVVSKSFTTQETLTNAKTVKDWLVSKLGKKAISDHFVAVSSNPIKALDFGIEKQNIFPMYDWVGGRFSLWSAVGLSISLSIGPNNFEKLLEGAEKMDSHFLSSSFSKNLPVVLALITIWYNNFFDAQSEVIIPYTEYLSYLPSYLQQSIMESNGKSIDRNGAEVQYQTGNIVWGQTGTNSQHAFFQLLHQGTKVIPCHFIGYKHSLHGNKEHHDKLMANFFAQTEALMKGKSRPQVEKDLIKQDISSDEIKKILPHKEFKGDKPSTTLLIDKLTPETIGSLIAMYEHKIFVEGVIWNIFSFDQYGVELGKELANNILKNLKTSSTRQGSLNEELLKRYKS